MTLQLESPSMLSSAERGAAAAAAAGHRRRSSVASSPARCKSLSAAGSQLGGNINLGVLQHLESVFLSADADGSGELSMDEFVAAFHGVISSAEGSDEESLRKLFMRIDANCDAAVDWDEFSAYLLMEKTGGGASTASAGSSGSSSTAYETVEPGPLPVGAAHRELICSLLHVDTGNGPDKWFSAAGDGTVRVWNGKDLSHLRTMQTPLPAITCGTYLPASGLLALGSHSPSVLLIDPASGDQAGRLQAAASSAALSLVGWEEGGSGRAGPALVSGDRELLGVGDADGGVSLWEIVVNPPADKRSANRYTGKALWRSGNHRDWVVAMVQLPSNALLAASLDKKLSITDVERCIAVKTLSGHEKSVTCCAWSAPQKMAVSGGADCKVLLWDPCSCRPLAGLKGHSSAVVALAVNEREHQIISAAAEKTIKVWDLRSQRCVQTLSDPAKSATPVGTSSSGGRSDTLSALVYSPQRRLLVSAGYQPRGWPLTDTRDKATMLGHRDPVSCVLFNPMFAEAVSADHAGVVCVWHVMTGRLRFSFDTHSGSRITAASFDGHHRRLLAGSEDGSVRVFNFSSGSLLSTLATRPASSCDCSSGCEVTGLAVASSNGESNIIVTGWDRQVCWYSDSGRRRCDLLRSSSGPTSDVLTAALMPGYPTLATGCASGEIFLWNVDSGAVRRKLVPPELSSRPEHERAVERLAFMTGQLRHVLVAVGADRCMRLWDSHNGTLLLQHFTGHCQGESVAALALSPDNTTAVTADSAGYIMVWDMSACKAFAAAGAAGGRPDSAAAAGRAPSAARPLSAARSHAAVRALSRIACWRGHRDAVTALAFVMPPSPAAAAAATASMQQLLFEENRLQPDQESDQRAPAGFFVSASLDSHMCLWSTAGGLLGEFGRHSWQLDLLSSWHAAVRPCLKANEEFDMLVSRNQGELQEQQPPPGSAAVSGEPGASSSCNGGLFGAPPAGGEGPAAALVTQLGFLVVSDGRRRQRAQQAVVAAAHGCAGAAELEVDVSKDDMPSTLWLPQFD